VQNMDSDKPKFLVPGCECAYCAVNNMPNIYHCNRRLYWTEIPRNASSAMKDTFNWQLIPHSEITKHGVVKPIVIYRDPVERFVSLIDHYFNGAVGRSPYGRDWFQEVLNKDMLSLTPKQRVDCVLESLDQLHNIAQRHHFLEQTKFIATDYFSEYTMIPLSEASKILNIGNSHKSIRIIGIDHFDSDQIDKIKKIYHEDYVFFNLRK